MSDQHRVHWGGIEGPISGQLPLTALPTWAAADLRQAAGVAHRWLPDGELWTLDTASWRRLPESEQPEPPELVAWRQASAERERLEAESEAAFAALESARGVKRRQAAERAARSAWEDAAAAKEAEIRAEVAYRDLRWQGTRPLPEGLDGERERLERHLLETLAALSAIRHRQLQATPNGRRQAGEDRPLLLALRAAQERIARAREVRLAGPLPEMFTEAALGRAAARPL